MSSRIPRLRRLSLWAAVALAAVTVFLAASGAPPAQAQDTVTLVSNAGQTKTDTAEAGASSQSQGFTTGSNTYHYTLTSIEVTTTQNPSAAESAKIKAEVWSSTSDGKPDAKQFGLTGPSDIAAGVVSFTAPAHTTLQASTTYHLVVWTTDSYSFSMDTALSDDEDSGGATGWSIANVRRWIGASDPSNPDMGDIWDTANPKVSLKISVKGKVKEAPAITLTSSDADDSVAETNADQTVTLTATLNDVAGPDGVTVALARQSASTATATSDYTLPESISISSGQTQGTATLTIKGDALVESSEELKLTASATDWASGSLTFTITDDDAAAAKIAFHASDAASPTALTARELEDVTAGTYDVPVTVSHLPQTNTTFTINVLATGTDRATKGTDYTIPTSVSFGPSDTSKTKNVTITLTDDRLVENSETISLQIAAADATPNDLGDHYTRHTNGSKATITILDDDAPNAYIAFHANNARATMTLTPSVDENVAGGTLNVPVTVSHLPGAATTFTIEVFGGTATECDPGPPEAKNDFCIAAKTVSFDSTGAKTKNVAIKIGNDDLVEADQTIQLRIKAADDPKDDLGDHYTRDAVGNTDTDGAGSEATVTINDDESDGAKIAFGRSATSTTKYSIGISENGGTLNIPITINHKPEDDTTFTVSVLNTGTATENTDYAITTKSFTFTATGAKTQNLAVTLTNDNLVERDQTVELEIASGTGLFSHYGRHAQGKLAKVSIADDEQTKAKIVIGGSVPADMNSATVYMATVAETVSGGTLSVPVTISHLPEGTTTFTVEVTGGKARQTDDPGNPTGNPKDYDFAATSVEFDATPGGLSKNLTINIADDTVEEDNEEIQFRIKAARPANDADFDLGDYYERVTKASTAQVTLTSEDQVATVTLKVNRAASGTGEIDVVEGSNVTVTATADIPVGPGGWRVVTENTWLTEPPFGGMHGTVSGGCTRQGQWPAFACPNDYQLPAGFTIQEGQTEATATLRFVSDSRAEDTEERMRLRGTATRGSRTLTTNTLDLHISDTNAGLSLSAPTFELVPTETATYTVALRGVQPTQNVTITPTSGDTDKATVSCTANPCALTFTPQNWEDPQEITVAAVAAGKATITHAATSTDTTYSGLSGLGSVGVTVKAPVQQYRIDRAAIGIEGESAELTITLGALAPTGGLSFTVDRTRTNDLKYLTPNPPVRTPEAGLADAAADLDTPPATVTVDVGKRTATLTEPFADDDLVEGDEHYYIVVSTSTTGWSPAPMTHPAHSQTCDQDAACAKVTIVDANPGDAKIAFGDNADATTAYTASAAESAGTLAVPVTISTLPAAETTFDIEVLTTGTGLATEGTDYAIATKSVTFGPTDTDTTKNVTVTLTDDTDAEGDEIIRLRIAEPDASANDLGGYYKRHLNGSQATLTITDDDGAVEVSASSVSVRPDTTTTYTVRLRGAQPTSNVTVAVVSDDTDKATVDPALLTFTNATWNRTQTVTVAGVAEGTATITHTVGGTDSAYPSTLSVGTVGVTVTSLPVVSLQVSPNPKVREGSSVTVTLTLSEPVGTLKTLPIVVTPAADNPAEPEDYTAPANIPISSGQTRATAIIRTHRDTDTDDEKFIVALGPLPSSVVAGTPAEITVTITDAGSGGPGGPTVGGPTGGGGGGGSDEEEAAGEATRLWGADRYATSLAVAREVADHAGGKLSTVVLAGGHSWADALVAGPLAGALDAAVLLSPPNGLDADATAWLGEVGVREIIAVGDAEHITDEALAALTHIDASIERITASDRYATAAAVARRIGQPETLGPLLGRTVIVASGRVFADALAAGPLAASGPHPILLVGPDGLHPDAVAYLAEFADHVIIMGGTAAVGSDIESQLRAIPQANRPGTRPMAVTRLGGTDRYGTAVAFARWLTSNSALEGRVCFTNDTVGLATGTNAADAATSAPLLARMCAPLVLTYVDQMPSITAIYLRRAAELLVFGGRAAISDNVIDDWEQ